MSLKLYIQSHMYEYNTIGHHVFDVHLQKNIYTQYIVDSNQCYHQQQQLDIDQNLSSYSYIYPFNQV